MGSNNQPRSFKFYRQNEKEVMEKLGLKPTKNSGSGWIEKEDGQNEYLICQLKSTDAQSIKVNQKDIRTLEDNAKVAHKLPMFAIQFLNTGEVWIMARPEDIQGVSQYISTGAIDNSHQLDLGINFDIEDVTSVDTSTTIKSNANAREQFARENEQKYKKGKRSAK